MLLRAANELHVWRIDLARDDSSYAAPLTVLSQDERRRADRFVAECDRHRFVVAHAALRMILRLYTGVDATSIVFDAGKHGKPSLSVGTGDGVRFNLSHSGDLALCAVTGVCDVGVDVERIRGDLSFERIARQFLSAAEQRMLAGVPAEYRAETFTEIWVRKEAYLKATGEGIGADLTAFSVTPGDGNSSDVTVADAGADWSIVGVPVPEDYRAAVATPVPLRLSLRQFGEKA